MWGGCMGGTVGQQVCITFQGNKFNCGPKALRKEFSRQKMRQQCGNSPYKVVHPAGIGGNPLPRRTKLHLVNFFLPSQTGLNKFNDVTLAYEE